MSQQLNVFEPRSSSPPPSTHSSVHQMKKLYSAQVARPLATTNTRPTRLGFATTAWCRYEDLIAAISGCGAVAVFHADAPGEATLLVGVKRAPARHVIWRNAPEKPAMLVVADAAGRITFWLARDRRVNVWSAVATVDLTAVAVAVGWNNSCTALAAVLAHGGLSVYAVRDEPFETTRRRAHQKSRDSSRRYLADPKWSSNAVKPIPCNQKLPDLFGGQLRCATVAPGHVDPTTVALVTVSAAQPHTLNVWTVTISKAGTAMFEVKLLSSTDMDAVGDGRCVACSVVPKRGMLVAVGDRGVIARWSLKTQRTAGDSSGWTLQKKTRIDRALEEAASRGVIPRIDDNQNTMVNAITRGLQVSKKRKVYAFEVTLDSMTIVTSTSAGLFVWDVDKLNITGGHLLKRIVGAETSPYWGLCISPGAAAVMALNGQGRVDTFSLISPLTRGSPETVPNAPTNLARRLVATTYTDGLRGGWDIIAAVTSEGSAAAVSVAKSLTLNNMRNIQNPPVSSEKLANLKSLMMRIVNAQDSTAHAAKRLLEVAIDAIRLSAPDDVKLKLMVRVKEAKQLTSVENIRKIIEQGLSTARINVHQLAAAPLADWVMVLSAVWLQRCAAMVATHDSKPQLGSAWANLAALASSSNQMEQADGMVSDPMLVHALRSAALAASVLVALEDEHGEPEAEPRYFRFPREQSPHVIAALWEVSVAWNSGEPASRPMVNGTPPSGTAPGHTAEHMQNTALAFRKHEAAAHAIAGADKLRVVAAEKALGLHGSAIGAGFIMSSTRKPFWNSPDSKTANGKHDSKPPKTEWCPYDLVTGRPLPPWAPLRRCIASGLLAAEITQQKSESTASVNGASPWISKWANESPFGGRWARVPSLDLDRYELLPSVVYTANRTDNASNNPTTRQAKPEDLLSQQSALSGGVAHQRAQLQRAGAMVNQQFSINTAQNAEAAALAAVAAGNPMAQMLGNANPQLQQGMPGMPANAILQGTLAGRMPAGAGRVHASPRMSTASSTTDAGSSISKGARKRMSSQTKGRARKRMTTEPRTPTASQLSELTRTMGMNGMPSVASPAAYARTASAPDAMSTDTRSTMTTATNAPGGVDQDTSKPGRKSRRRGSKAKQQAMDVSAQATRQAVEAAATAAAAAAAASAPGAIPPTVAGTLPPGVPSGLSQSSPLSHTPQTPRSAAQSKKQQARGNQRNHVTAAAHAAAAAAAAANKQSPLARNQAILQGALTPEALAAAGMNKAIDPMSSLGFVAGNPAAVSAGNAMAANVRRASVPLGGNAALMAGGNAANLALNGLLPRNNFGMQGVGDNGMGGITGQIPTDVTGIPHMAGANTANVPVVTDGASLARLAIELGLTPDQFTGLTQEQAQQTHQALSRRLALQNAAGQGPAGVQGTPPAAAPNPNLPPNLSAALTATDMNSNAAAASIGPMGPGSTALPLGSAVPQPSRGMIPGAAAMGSVGLPMTTPRSSATESQTSARVASGIAGTGIPTAPAQAAAERDSAGATGAIGGIPTPGGPGMQSSPGVAAAADRERRIIWTGNLHVVGQSSDMMCSIVGIQDDFPRKASIRDTRGWPRQLDLNPKKLKASTHVLDSLLSAPESQWYVRFVPVDKNGQEREEVKVRQLVLMMVERKLAFEIKCNEGIGTPGTLYVLGTPLQRHGPSLLGIFRPDETRPPDMGVDQELQLML